MTLHLSDRIQWCRGHLDELDRNGWAHIVGEPFAGTPLSWYPAELLGIYRLCDGLTTRFINFLPYRDQVKGLSEAKWPEEISLGSICYSFPVGFDIETSRLCIWDGEDFTTPEEWEEGEEPEPVFTSTDPVMFFDEFIFGPRYPELIDDILGYGAVLEPGDVDEWRELLGRADR